MGDKLAACHGLLSIDSQWHKTKDKSVAAFSFLANTDDFATNALANLEPEASVVTGTTGAWPKPENIQGFSFQVVVRGLFHFLYALRNRDVTSCSRTSISMQTMPQADPRVPTNEFPFRITIDYKQRGWNPSS